MNGYDTQFATRTPQPRALSEAPLRPHIWFGVLIVLFAMACTRPACASVTNCDPTANTVAGCIASATSNGTVAGTVVLVPNSSTSVFAVSATVTLYSNLKLRCEPNATIKQSGATGALLSASGRSNIVIENCIFDGNSGAAQGVTLQNVSGVRISRNTFQNFNAEGINGLGWTDVEIDSNAFSSVGPVGSNDSALYLYAQLGAAASTRIKVHDNTCNNLGQQSGCMKFAASSSGTINQIDVVNNILNVGTGSSSQNNLGIEFFATDSNENDIQQFTVTGNVITTNASSAYTSCISIGGIYGVIGHNTMRNCQLFGIEVIASHTNVLGNTLNNTGPISWDGNSGSHADVVIANNTTTGSTGAAAIHVIASNTNHNLFTGVVAHNIITVPAGSTAGILLQTVSGGGVFDIHVDDNMFESLTSSQRAVDSEGSPAQVQIENNRFINNTGTGLFLNGGTNFTIRLNYFNGGTWLQNNGATITRTVENIVNGICCQ